MAERRKRIGITQIEAGPSQDTPVTLLPLTNFPPHLLMVLLSCWLVKALNLALRTTSLGLIARQTCMTCGVGAAQMWADDSREGNALMLTLTNKTPLWCVSPDPDIKVIRGHVTPAPYAVPAVRFAPTISPQSLLPLLISPQS